MGRQDLKEAAVLSFLLQATRVFFAITSSAQLTFSCSALVSHQYSDAIAIFSFVYFAHRDS